MLLEINEDNYNKIIRLDKPERELFSPKEIEITHTWPLSEKAGEEGNPSKKIKNTKFSQVKEYTLMGYKELSDSQYMTTLIIYKNKKAEADYWSLKFSEKDKNKLDDRKEGEPDLGYPVPLVRRLTYYEKFHPENSNKSGIKIVFVFENGRIKEYVACSVKKNNRKLKKNNLK